MTLSELHKLFADMASGIVYLLYNFVFFADKVI